MDVLMRCNKIEKYEWAYYEINGIKRLSVEDSLRVLGKSGVDMQLRGIINLYVDYNYYSHRIDDIDHDATILISDTQPKKFDVDALWIVLDKRSMSKLLCKDEAYIEKAIEKVVLRADEMMTVAGELDNMVTGALFFLSAICVAYVIKDEYTKMNMCDIIYVIERTKLHYNNNPINLTLADNSLDSGSDSWEEYIKRRLADVSSKV